MKAREQLRDMRSLQAGWDSYSAQPIAPGAILVAQNLLDVLPGSGWQAVPVSDGGVQLEMHSGGIDIEIVVRDSRSAAEGQS